MHEIIFSRPGRHMNMFCDDLDSSNLGGTFCIDFMGICLIFYAYRVLSSFVFAVIIIYDGGIHSRDNLYYSKRFVAVFNNLCLTVKNSSNFLTEAKGFRVNFYR